jgi:hypothetical protein
MSLGFLPYLLLHQKQVYNGTAPSTKLTPPGYLKMLLANSTPNIVSSNIADGSGHIRDVKIKYRQRVPTGQSATSDDCSIQAKPVYAEATIPSLSFRKYGIFLDYATIAKYEKEASATVAVGQPAPPNGILMEIYSALIEAANGLLGDVNGDLLTAQASAFGKNVTNGLNTAKTVNFPLSTTSNPLNAGLTLLMSDVMENEIRQNNIIIVGSGLINNVYLQQALKTNNTADANYPVSVPPFYWDPAVTSKFGTNHFGVFEKNAVQLVNINKFDGFIGGDKMSTFLFTLQLPLIDSLGGTELQSFKFDAQLRHIDCPSEVEIGGQTTTVDRGWVLDLMCNYAQFNIASDAYATSDRLTGNNGTLRYVATNS